MYMTLAVYSAVCCTMYIYTRTCLVQPNQHNENAMAHALEMFARYYLIPHENSGKFVCRSTQCSIQWIYYIQFKYVRLGPKEAVLRFLYAFLCSIIMLSGVLLSVVDFFFRSPLSIRVYYCSLLLFLRCLCFYISCLVGWSHVVAIHSCARISYICQFYRNALVFNVCLKCRNEYKVYKIACNLIDRCEYVSVFCTHTQWTLWFFLFFFLDDLFAFFTLDVSKPSLSIAGTCFRFDIFAELLFLHYFLLGCMGTCVRAPAFNTLFPNSICANTQLRLLCIPLSYSHTNRFRILPWVL